MILSGRMFGKAVGGFFNKGIPMIFEQRRVDLAGKSVANVGSLNHGMLHHAGMVHGGVAGGRLQVVIVDGRCDRYHACYGGFFTAAADGRIGVHVCVDGRSAVRLARRFRADCWLVAKELPDMSGFDLLEMLLPHVHQAEVDPLRIGPVRSLTDRTASRHGGVFMVADAYSMADEQRSLAAGVAGYLVPPVGLNVVASMRLSPHATLPAGQHRASFGPVA
jgi:CheY-like chemotaxis protein